MEGYVRVDPNGVHTTNGFRESRDPSYMEEKSVRTQFYQRTLFPENVLEQDDARFVLVQSERFDLLR